MIPDSKEEVATADNETKLLQKGEISSRNPLLSASAMLITVDDMAKETMENSGSVIKRFIQQDTITQKPFIMPKRGDLPPILDSEEETNDNNENYILRSTQSMFMLGTEAFIRNTTDALNDTKNLQGTGDNPNALPISSLYVIPANEDINDTSVLLEEEIQNFRDPQVSREVSTTSTIKTTNTNELSTIRETKSPTTTTVSPSETVTTTTSSTKTTNTPSGNSEAATPLFTPATDNGHSHNKSKSYLDSLVEFGLLVPTTQPPEIITVYTPLPLQLDDKWTWFFMVLRGNCHFVDLTNSYVLFYDFVKSLSALLLYNREHIFIDSMTCSGRRMTVNISVDSLFYPNCEKDFRTLLSHRNLRINLHNTSFYIHSYETKRTLMFETKKEDVKEKKEEILYLTLGGVGISLMCILLASGLFVLYQCCIVKRRIINQTQVSNRFRAESPRSLCPKYEGDQNMRFSDQRTYSINMYKSYNDLTAPDLYSHLGSPSKLVQERDNPANNTTVLTQIPKEKTKKNKKKKNNNCYGFNDCDTYQEFWAESITHTNEDFMTVRNFNTTSSFKGSAKECDKDSLYPLLQKKKPKPPKKPLKVQDEYLLPPPPPPPPPTTTCPSSPTISKGVLERMDQLISDTYSNSTPDITGNGYLRSYSNTTVNISNASSAVFTNVMSEATSVSTESPLNAEVKTGTSPNKRKSASMERKPPSSTSASTDNLCLTRITFMGMENPSFRMETDM